MIIKKKKKKLKRKWKLIGNESDEIRLLMNYRQIEFLINYRKFNFDSIDFALSSILYFFIARFTPWSEKEK